MRSYQAITTKYFGASNSKGSRIKASAAAGSITLHLDNALSIEANHAKAARALAEKLDWRGAWAMGGMPDDQGYCFVCSDIGAAPAFITEGADR
ncbi:hypothetical protein HU675_0045030 [Bradyrhizobium septentrionale]|uniref:hypothetical protein n=1 Tax=Bradyrhizobium septentrionale TaxID=1404411 RepID=UPI001596F62F|nr:hypothetical protein [Bradyrhizobium septentrionale]UGY21557.1 hypothetical protein HU675_0026435 [Bradyrhizobium septentrionale]UGY24959.1 hypothetical protein HU675_0045030 [Bradyrhizobium septentrionale]